MSIASIQILNKVLNTKDINILTDNALTVEHFAGYQQQFDFIQQHTATYGNVPDKETFIEKFPQWEFFDVTEAELSLLDRINEEFLYHRAVKIIKHVETLMRTDANEAVDYLKAHAHELQATTRIPTTDIIANADERLKEYLEGKDGNQKRYIPSGFPELDKYTYGLKRGEDLFMVLARTNEGKSFVLIKMAEHCWEHGEVVGFISPEMSTTSVGYRFDSAYEHVSLEKLMKSEPIKEYESYIQKLKTNTNKFYVSDMDDFPSGITIEKVRQFVVNYGITALFIDGIEYLNWVSDKYIPVHEQLGNIAKGLLDISKKFKIPVAAVVQSNRDGDAKKNKGQNSPSTGTISGSDKIGRVATRVITLKQIGNLTDEIPALEMTVDKNRHGKARKTVVYKWYPDTTEFFNIPTTEEIPVVPIESMEKMGSVF